MMAIFFTYFIQFYVPMQIMVPPLQKGSEKCKLGIDVFMRTAMVMLTCKYGVDALYKFVLHNVSRLHISPSIIQLYQELFMYQTLHKTL